MNEEPREVTFTREELYHEVWKTAMRVLAPQYGLSDVGLAKVCKRHNIPRPPVGYWAKLQHGYKPRKTPLPKSDDPELQTITLIQGSHAGPLCADEEEVRFDEDVRILLHKIREMPDPKVKTQLRNLHPLVEVTRDALADAHPDQHNLLGAYRSEKGLPLCVRVSQGCVRRTLLFLDTFIKTIESLGGTVRTEEKFHHRQAIVRLCTTDVATIRVRERYRQVKRKPNSGGSYSWHTYDYIPTGRLVLDSGPSYDTYCFCQDTEKGQRIEGRIKRVLTRFARTVGRLRIEAREEEVARKMEEKAERIRQIRVQELERRTQELVGRQKAEQSRVDDLIDQANSRRQSNIIREYVAEVRALATERYGAIEAESEVGEWLAWARNQADRLDPLAESPHSVLDEPMPRLEDIEITSDELS